MDKKIRQALISLVFFLLSALFSGYYLLKDIMNLGSGNPVFIWVSLVTIACAAYFFKQAFFVSSVVE